MKRLFLILLLLPVVFTVQGALAYTGWCQTKGGPQTLSYSFDVTIEDFNNAEAGKQINDVYDWNIPGSFSVICDQQPGTELETFFMAKADLPLSHTDANGAFYKVNEYLSAQTQIYIYNSTGGNGGYHYVPFNDVGNRGKTDHSDYTTGWGSGTKGKVNLYIDRKMAQTTTISPIVIANLYASMQKGSYGSEPIAQIFMSGTITVPQSCVINSGTNISVPFGNIYASDFTTKGEKPTGIKAKTFSIPVKCSNISSSANLTVRFVGTSSPDLPDALQSTNKDVGFLIRNSSGQVLTPGTGVIPFTLNNDIDEQAEITVTAEPVSTTGKMPDEGEFQAIAVIRVDFS